MVCSGETFENLKLPKLHFEARNLSRSGTLIEYHVYNDECYPLIFYYPNLNLKTIYPLIIGYFSKKYREIKKDILKLKNVQYTVISFVTFCEIQN